MTTTEVVRQTPKQKTLAELINKMQPEIAKALPRHISPDRMARIAVTVVRQTPTLANCTPESFLGALLTASQLGLEPGPTGEAYFVPYGQQCTFIPGYRGLIKLARQSGQVSDIYAEIVYENDDFEVTLGLHRDLAHKVVDRANRGKPTDVYAVAKFKDGTDTFVTMTVGEVEAIRKRSKASSNGPWVTDWSAMAKKTAVKQLAKWLPLSAEFNSAVVLDGSTRTDVCPLTDVQPQFVDGEVLGDQMAIPVDAHETQMISRAQIDQLDVAFKAEKITDTESQIELLARALGKPVGGIDELTAADAVTALDILQGA